MSNSETDANPANSTDEAPSVMSLAKFHVVCSCAVKEWGACDKHSDLESRTQALAASLESLSLEELKVPPFRFYYYKAFPVKDETIFHFFIPSDDDIQGEVEEAARIMQLKLPSSKVMFCPPFSAAFEGFRNMQIRAKSGSLMPEISTVWNKARNDRVPPAVLQLSPISGVEFERSTSQPEYRPHVQGTSQAESPIQYILEPPTDGTQVVISYDPNGLSKPENKK
jgi:hypothetical protein